MLWREKTKVNLWDLEGAFVVFGLSLDFPSSGFMFTHFSSYSGTTWNSMYPEEFS